MTRSKGFTLIELVMIIVILGILAAVAIPRHFDLQAQARQAAEDGIVGSVRAGIYTVFAQNRAFPANLDGCGDNACDSCTAGDCFDGVLEYGISDSNWSRAGQVYTNSDTTNTYTYTPGDGSFK